ncbi:MAG: hypothetical protein VYD64_02570 [Pseudomonadota bacterium]|nr:hypothetical protein [Pseudomonadota bacterium]
MTYHHDMTREAIASRIEQHLAAAEALIATLDETEGNPDLGPSLGWPEAHAGRGAEALLPYGDDLELDDIDDEDGADDEPGGDDEPFLGWVTKDDQGTVIGRDTPVGTGLYEADDSGDVSTSRNCYLSFDGSGRRAAKSQLRGLSSTKAARAVRHQNREQHNV